MKRTAATVLAVAITFGVAVWPKPPVTHHDSPTGKCYGVRVIYGEVVMGEDRTFGLLTQTDRTAYRDKSEARHVADLVNAHLERARAQVIRVKC